MKQLRNRLVRLLEKGEITDIEEIKEIRIFNKSKEMESILHKTFCNYCRL